MVATESNYTIYIYYLIDDFPIFLFLLSFRRSLHTYFFFSYVSSYLIIIFVVVHATITSNGRDVVVTTLRRHGSGVLGGVVVAISSHNVIHTHAHTNGRAGFVINRTEKGASRYVSTRACARTRVRGTFISAPVVPSAAGGVTSVRGARGQQRTFPEETTGSALIRSEDAHVCIDHQHRYNNLLRRRRWRRFRFYQIIIFYVGSFSPCVPIIFFPSYLLYTSIWNTA